MHVGQFTMNGIGELRERILYPNSLKKRRKKKVLVAMLCD